MKVAEVLWTDMCNDSTYVVIGKWTRGKYRKIAGGKWYEDPILNHLQHKVEQIQYESERNRLLIGLMKTT